MPHQSAPEHDLLVAASCRSGSDPAIARALENGVDWTYLTHLCLQHRVAPSLLMALESADPALVPEDFLHALRRYCGDQHDKSRELVLELFAMLDALDRRRVVAVPFKGPLLGALVFGDIGQREPGDLDLLVHRKDVVTTREVLERRGYTDAGGQPGAPPLTDAQRELYEKFQCEYQFVRPSDDMVVEPHWELSQRPLALEVDYVGMLGRAIPTELCGRVVLVLAPADQLVALCIHGAKHHWQRLSWIRDVAGVLTRWPDLDLAGVVEGARRVGCGRLMTLSLAVVSECAGLRLPAAVNDAIARDKRIDGLKAQVFAQLFEADQVEPRNDRIHPFRMHLRERVSDRLRYAIRTWVTPRRHHLELVALPAALQWTYFPIKIGLDFAILPVRNAISPRRRTANNEKSFDE